MTETTSPTPAITFADDAWDTLDCLLNSWAPRGGRTGGNGMTVRITLLDGSEFTASIVETGTEEEGTFGHYTLIVRRWADENTEPADDAPTETHRLDAIREIHLY